MTIPRDFLIEVAKGNVSGHSLIHKFGRNPDIDTADGFEVVWNGGAQYTGFNVVAAELVALSSDSANDTAAGTGARTVRIIGLDENYKEQDEIITLNGLTSVDSVKTYIRMDRMRVITAGSGEGNAGTLTAGQKTTTANIFAVMPPGYNSTMIAAYTVPAGKKAFFLGWYGALNGAVSADCEFRLSFRPKGQTMQTQEEISTRSAGSSSFNRSYQSPKDGMTEKTDVCIAANTDANNAEAVAGFELLLYNA